MSHQKKSSFKSGPRDPIGAYRHIPSGRKVGHPLEESVLGVGVDNEDYIPISKPPTRFNLERNEVEFHENNEPNKLLKRAQIKSGITMQKKSPINKRSKTKHPRSNPRFAKTYVSISGRKKKQTKDPMEESMYGQEEDPSRKYVEIYHRANQPPINNNDNHTSGASASASASAPASNGIPRKNSRTKKRVAHDPQTTTTKFNVNNEPQKVGKTPKNITVERTNFGPKKKPTRNRKL